MATTPATLVSINAVDASGLSVVTAGPNLTDARAGAIYSPSNVAAAVPLHFHPLKDGRFLMVAQRFWTAATIVAGQQAKYSSYTELGGCWAILNGGTGTLERVAGGLEIPIRTSVDTAQAVSATSKPQDLLWVLHQVTLNGNVAAIAQWWEVNYAGAISLTGEEVLPTIAVDADTSVVFDKGINYDGGSFVVVYGTDQDDKLYCIRKNFGRIGYNRGVQATVPNKVSAIEGMAWQYYTGTGWSNDPTELAPMQDGVTTQAPVSFGSWRTQRIMTTVNENLQGVFWTSNSGRPWLQAAEAVDLGQLGDGSYVGAGVQLQDQVGASSVAAAGSNAAIPYVSTKRSTSGGNSLTSSWGVRLVTLVS